MFEAAELGHTISKQQYKEEAEELRAALLSLQGELADANFPVIILITGVEGAGKGETGDLLLEWMDARGIHTEAFADRTEAERERPDYWRYWMALPPNKKIGILFGAWYTEPAVDYVHDRIGLAEFDQKLDRILEFERMLTAEGALVLKFWMHLSRSAQKKRLKKLEKDPVQSWRVTKREWEFHEHYDRYREAYERCLRRTSTGEAPWHIVEGLDHRYRELTVAQTLRKALEERLAVPQVKPVKPKPEDLPKPEPLNVLNQLDLTLELSKETYKKELLKYQARLNMLTRELHDTHRSMILVFEGPDAAGKGGAIRRITAAMDARLYRVISVAAPTDEERLHPYLWRFWRHLPPRGRVTIYDRSWYGRVLVERLEGFADEAAWQRAYAEINAFEEQLAESDILVIKFWLEISADEQALRFEERAQTPYKQYKITDEDWRNREKWDAYQAAACDMIERTGTAPAPWNLVEANNKRWARIKVLHATCDQLERVLEHHRK